MTPGTGRWLPVGLVALAAIPVAAGTARLVEMLGGPELIPQDARAARRTRATRTGAALAGA